MENEQEYTFNDDNEFICFNGETIAESITYTKGVDDVAQCKELIRKANAYPKLVEALKAARIGLYYKTGGAARESAFQIVTRLLQQLGELDKKEVEDE